MVATIPVDGSWRELALCAQVDPELFFPEEGQPSRAAKRVCAGCSVKAECLEDALRLHTPYGIFGGLSEDERRRLARDRRAAARADGGR